MLPPADMLEAFLWGAFASAFLLVGAAVAYTLTPGKRPVAVVMALGAGLLIGSVSFELVDEALKTSTVGWVGLLVLVGAGVYTAGDWWLTRSRSSGSNDNDDAPQAIVLGSVLDGIPESFVLGLTVLQGGVSVALLSAVALSNFPEGMASSAGLRQQGWSAARVTRLWLIVLVASAVASAAGYVLLDNASPAAGALAQAFAAGALLAMVADALLPQSYAVEGVWTGPLVVSGFAISLVLSSL